MCAITWPQNYRSLCSHFRFRQKYFQSIRENQSIQADVIGVRFELNDPYICIIGELRKEKMNYKELKGGDNSEESLMLPNFDP